MQLWQGCDRLMQMCQLCTITYALSDALLILKSIGRLAFVGTAVCSETLEL
jgi:hypothetical protein